MEPFRDGIAIRRERKEKTQYFSGVDPDKISVKVKIDDREYEEPFTGELLQCLIEGAMKQEARSPSPKGMESKPRPPATKSIPGQIKKLAELRDGGILTPEEFETKKAELLERL